MERATPPPMLVMPMFRRPLLIGLMLASLVACSGPQDTHTDPQTDTQPNDPYAWLPAASTPAEDELQSRFKALDAQHLELEEGLFHALVELEKANDAELEKALQEALTAYGEGFRPLSSGYREVVDSSGDPILQAAALVRIGDGFWAIGDFVRRAPVPSRLNGAQKIIYEDILLEFSDTFGVQAIQHYTAAVELADAQSLTDHPLVTHAQTQLAPRSDYYSWLPEPESDEQRALQERFKTLDTEQSVLEIELFAGLEDLKVHPEPEKRLQELLNEHSTTSQKLVASYEEIVKTSGDPVLATAVMVRTGDAFWTLAELIMSSPVPAKLTEEQAQTYQDALSEFSIQFEQRALQFYGVATEKAAELDVPENPLLARAAKRLGLK